MLHAEHGAVHPTPPQTPDWAQSPWLLGKSPNPGSQLGPPLSGGWRLPFLDLQFSLFRLHVSGLQGEAYRAGKRVVRPIPYSPLLQKGGPADTSSAQLCGRGLGDSKQCSVQTGIQIKLV